MKYFLFAMLSVWIVLLSFTHCFGNKDSLRTIWEDKTQVDTVRLNALFDLTTNYYFYNDLDSAIVLSKLYLDFAKSIANEEKVAVGLSLVGNAHHIAGHNEETIDFYDQAYKAFLALGNEDKALNVLLNTNMTYKRLGKWKEVVQNLEALLPKIKANKDVQNLATAQGLLTSIYGEQGLYEKSLSMALENYTLLPYLEETNKIDVIIDVARAYESMKDLDLAIQYQEEALKISEKLHENLSILSQLKSLINLKIAQNDTTTLASYIVRGEKLASSFENTYNWVAWKYQLAEYYIFKNEFHKADTLLRKGLAVAISNKYVSLVPYLQFAIGINAIDMRDFKTAKAYCHQSYEIAKNELQSLEMIQQNCDCLYKAYKALNQPLEALTYLEESMSLKDSLFNEKTTKATTRIAMQYEFDQEKKETELLYQAELQRQRLIQYGLIAGLSLLALLAFFIYQNYRNKTKANQLITAQKVELETLNATKDRLFAIIGHDLRKPSLAFRGIGKKIDYLLQKQDFDTLGKLSQSLEQAAFSLNALLDNLLNWALQQRNVLPYQPVPINIAQATQDIYEQFQTVAAQKEIDLQINLPEDAEVFADANAFTTIMRNLVDNAIKFTPTQGQVKVSSLAQGDKIMLQISDTGIGMEEKELNTLFELKSQKSRKGTNGEAGTGLGLVLVNELIKLNKGAIQVSSQLRKGTTFEVVLPANS